jgi:hypothetical protein
MGIPLPRAERRRPHALADLVTAVAIFAVAVAMLRGPLLELRAARRAVPAVVVARHESLRDLHGHGIPLLARDSVTVLVMLDDECGTCRRELPTYSELRDWGGPQDIAIRLVAADSESAARLSSGNAVLSASPALFARLSATRVPSTVFLDSRGFVRHTVIGRVPNQQDIVALANENTGWAHHGRWQKLDGAQ